MKAKVIKNEKGESLGIAEVFSFPFFSLKFIYFCLSNKPSKTNTKQFFKVMLKLLYAHPISLINIPLPTGCVSRRQRCRRGDERSQRKNFRWKSIAVPFRTLASSSLMQSLTFNDYAMSFSFKPNGQNNIISTNINNKKYFFKKSLITHSSGAEDYHRPPNPTKSEKSDHQKKEAFFISFFHFIFMIHKTRSTC